MEPWPETQDASRLFLKNILKVLLIVTDCYCMVMWTLSSTRSRLPLCESTQGGINRCHRLRSLRGAAIAGAIGAGNAAMCHRCQERSRPSTTRMMKKLHHLRRRRRWAKKANFWRNKSIQTNRNQYKSNLKKHKKYYSYLHTLQSGDENHMELARLQRLQMMTMKMTSEQAFEWGT